MIIFENIKKAHDSIKESRVQNFTRYHLVFNSFSLTQKYVMLIAQSSGMENKAFLTHFQP